MSVDINEIKSVSDLQNFNYKLHEKEREKQDMMRMIT